MRSSPRILTTLVRVVASGGVGAALVPRLPLTAVVSGRDVGWAGQRSISSLESMGTPRVTKGVTVFRLATSDNPRHQAAQAENIVPTRVGRTDEAA